MVALAGTHHAGSCRRCCKYYAARPPATAGQAASRIPQTAQNHPAENAIVLFNIPCVCPEPVLGIAHWSLFKRKQCPKTAFYFIFRTHRSGIEIVRRPAAGLLDLLVQLFAGERLPKIDIAHHLCVVRAVAVDLGGVSSPTETPLFFECFPYVCPEPFLVK